jgi:hypothetical protein
MKSGSTWLLTNLRQHPDIYVCPGRHFTLNAGPEGWRQPTPGGYRGQKILAARRNMKGQPEFASVYWRHNPKMKFVMLVRNPVERAYSEYRHYVYIEPHKMRLMRYATGARRRTWRHTVFDFNVDCRTRLDAGPEEEPYYVMRSRYYTMLEPYLKLFAKDQFLILALEKVVAEPEAHVARILAFLGVDATFRSPRLREVLNPNEGLVRRGPWWWRSLASRRIKTVPPDEETVARLREIFLPDARRLSELTGFDLAGLWKLER